MLTKIASRMKTKLKQIHEYISFKRDFYLFKDMDKDRRFPLLWKDRKPCLHDKKSTLVFDKHYVNHTAWAARILKKLNIHEHVDISSYIYFVTIASAFISIRHYEYRPLNIILDGLQLGQVDLLSLPFDNSSIPSLSCMHVVEHIGLGRYGDPLDPEGDLKAIAEIKRVTALEGNLLFVVPVGRPKIMFNAHRIYAYDQVISHFDGFKLMEFALIPDEKEQESLIYQATKQMADNQTYGCGCFWFRKQSSGTRI